MIHVEGISMAEQPEMRFDMMHGLLRSTGGRGIMLNGISFEVPQDGFAFIGFELVIVDKMMMPKARVLAGAMAPRYGAMRFGEEQLNQLIQQSAMVGGMDVPFMFSFKHPRPRISVN